MTQDFSKGSKTWLAEILTKQYYLILSLDYFLHDYINQFSVALTIKFRSERIVNNGVFSLVNVGNTSR